MRGEVDISPPPARVIVAHHCLRSTNTSLHTYLCLPIIPSLLCNLHSMAPPLCDWPLPPSFQSILESKHCLHHFSFPRPVSVPIATFQVSEAKFETNVLTTQCHLMFYLQLYLLKKCLFPSLNRTLSVKSFVSSLILNHPLQIPLLEYHFFFNASHR